MGRGNAISPFQTFAEIRGNPPNEVIRKPRRKNSNPEPCFGTGRETKTSHFGTQSVELTVREFEPLEYLL